MEWTEVCARRLAAHSLATPAAADDLVCVVRAMCGVHAQVAAAAEVSVGVRVAGITVADVRAALWERRTLVRTYGPRGTVHLLPAEDLGLWLAALAAARPAPRISPEGGLDGGQLDAVLGAIADALADGRALTWRELGDEVITRVGSWAGDEVFPAFGERWPRWRPAIATAAARGLLCFGPNRGNQVTYVGLERWLPGFAVPDDGAAALAAVASCYLDSYGPARPADFAQWLAMPPAAAQRVFATLDLVEVDVEGRRAWLPRDAAPVNAAPPAVVRLLPHFDAYVVGCHPRSAVFPGVAAQRALNRGAAGQVPVLLVDGVVAGVWQHRRSGQRLTVTVEPFGAVDPAPASELERQAQRVGEIMEVSATLVVGEVAARPHL